MAEIHLQTVNKYRQKLWFAAQKLAFPSVLWRLPNQKDKHFLTSFNENPPQTKIDFEELGSGFAFSPFENTESKSAYFLNADLHIVFDENEQFEEVIVPSEFDTDYQKINAFVSKNETEFKALNTALIETSNDEEKKRFVTLVQKGIEAIESEKFQKVVPSRTKKIILSENYDLVEIFDKACKLYPTAFVSMISLPHLGVVWMCASPEVLVSQNSNGIFKTMALAGTQSAFDKDGNLIKPSEALWRQKEIEEQAFVSRYIINCLKKIRVREFEEIGPKTVIAGNLMHLRTDFLIDTNEVNFPQLATVMLDLLHPTSAVCGMPKEPATQFLLENEGYDREFYSGYLGPVNIKQESHIFVNLRTMKIQNNEATLYAGCGITIDSDAEKEWLETEMKCETLGKIFR